MIYDGLTTLDGLWRDRGVLSLHRRSVPVTVIIVTRRASVSQSRSTTLRGTLSTCKYRYVGSTPYKQRWTSSAMNIHEATPHSTHSLASSVHNCTASTHVRRAERPSAVIWVTLSCCRWNPFHVHCSLLRSVISRSEKAKGLNLVSTLLI